MLYEGIPGLVIWKEKVKRKVQTLLSMLQAELFCF